MSTESSIAAMTTQAAQLMDVPQQVLAAAQAQIAAIGGAYQGHLAALAGTFYVDQALGLDTAAGTNAAPLKSLGKALALTPRGGVCTVFLKGDYVQMAPEAIDGRTLVLLSNGPTKHALSFNRLTDTAGTPNRYPAAFAIFNGGRIGIFGLTLRVPLLEEPFLSKPLLGYYRGIISCGGYAGYELLPITIGNCQIEIPATPFCPIVGDGVGVALSWSSNTLTGAITSIAGRLFGSQTNTAGVASNTLPWLVTSLATV